MQHVNDAAKIGTTAVPPGVATINDQVVADVESLVFAKLLKLKAIKQCLVDPVRDARAECRRVVILLDLPDGDRVNNGRESTVYASGQCPERDAISCDGRQSAWIVVAGQTLGVVLDEHVDDAG